MPQKLSWISDKDLYAICEHIVRRTQEVRSCEVSFDNIIDPFSAVFDSAIHGISLEEWITTEKIRQNQKTLQNMIGEFHQKVIGSIAGWADLGTGKVVDLANKDKKIIAEAKNKFNTTKGNHRPAIYDDIKDRLKRPEYKGFTGYYVAVLTKNRYDQPFAPSDNKTGSRRPVNEKIREIDGVSFYEKATGSKTALFDLYNVLPSVLAEITGTPAENITSGDWFLKLFLQASKK